MIKESEGEILKFIAKAQQLPLTPAQTQDLNQVAEIVRAIVYSCKTLKDIAANLAVLSEEEEYTENQFQQQRDYHLSLYGVIPSLLYGDQALSYVLEECDALLANNDQHQQAMDQRIYQSAGRAHMEASFISTQLNVNREVHHATKNLLHGLKVWAQLQLQ